MSYQIEDEDGKLNNFALEPKMYKAEPKTGNDQRNLVFIGILGAVLVIGLIAVTFLVSGAS